MPNIPTAIVMHIMVGSLAAGALVVLGLVSVALGGEGSQVSPARRLPGDSDAQLLGLSAVVGAVCGLVFAFLSGFGLDWFWLAPTGLLSFFVGSFLGYQRASKLNDQYLARAHESFEQGKYKEALEDAREVARSSERLRAEANRIVEKARVRRMEQPLGAEIGTSQAAPELAETLSN